MIGMYRLAEPGVSVYSSAGASSKELEYVELVSVSNRFAVQLFYYNLTKNGKTAVGKMCYFDLQGTTVVHVGSGIVVTGVVIVPKD